MGSSGLLRAVVKTPRSAPMHRFVIPVATRRTADAGDSRCVSALAHDAVQEVLVGVPRAATDAARGGGAHARIVAAPVGRLVQRGRLVMAA